MWIITGGFVPKGYKTELGPNQYLSSFGVMETLEESYSERTVKNVLGSDGTVIFSKLNLSEKIEGDGTMLTYQTALKNNKHLIVNPGPVKLANWIMKNEIEVLNVAGDRASLNPTIYNNTRKTLKAAIKLLRTK